MSSVQEAKNHRCSTGVQGLDEILRGGLTQHRIYLVQGEPGTGKTTLALQFLLEGIKQGEKCLYITFSETREELEATAKSHHWDLNGLDLFELSALEDKLKPHRPPYGWSQASPAVSGILVAVRMKNRTSKT